MALTDATLPDAVGTNGPPHCPPRCLHVTTATAACRDWSCPLISGNTHLVDWKVDDADQCCFGKGGWSDPCKY